MYTLLKVYEVHLSVETLSVFYTIAHLFRILADTFERAR